MEHNKYLIVFKIYYWFLSFTMFFFLLGLVSVLSLGDISEVIDKFNAEMGQYGLQLLIFWLIDSAFTLIGFNGYIYNQKHLNVKFWKLFFFVAVISSIVNLDEIDSILNIIAWIIFTFIKLYPLYQYAFKMETLWENKEEVEIN